MVRRHLAAENVSAIEDHVNGNTHLSQDGLCSDQDTRAVEDVVLERQVIQSEFVPKHAMKAHHWCAHLESDAVDERAKEQPADPDPRTDGGALSRGFYIATCTSTNVSWLRACRKG